MPLSFPASPVLNQTYTLGGAIWTYDGTGWVRSGYSSNVSGPTNFLVSSRTAVATDNFTTIELGTGVTYTLTDTVQLSGGLVILGPTSGIATLAVSGAALINGGTASISISSGATYSVIPRGSNPNSYIVAGV